MAPALAPALLPAHGVGNRHDLPLPFTFVVVGAVVALVVSFAALTLWRARPRDPADAGRPLPHAVAAVLDARPVRAVLAGLAGLLALVTLAALFVGSDRPDNPAPYVVFVWLWVGLPFLSLLLGPVWRVLDPVRRAHGVLSRSARVDPAAGLRPLPPWVGYRPAALGLLAFAWLELVQPDRATRSVLLVYVVAYLVVTLPVSLVAGRSWFRRGDPFGVLSELYGALALLGRRQDGRRVLRGPVAGAAGVPRAPGLLAAVSVMLGTTAYDGVQGQLAWTSAVQSSPSPLLWQAAGLLGVIGVVAATAGGAGAVAARVAGRPVRGVPTAFATSLVPVAAGYVVAHYWSLLVYGGQETWKLLADPLGTGADLLGVGGLTPSTALIQPQLTAVVQVVAIVTGHVVGLVVAHDVAVRLFPRRAAVLGQVPVLVVMVGYTVAGLLLLFAA